jgi:3-polyprenyl-4-hydroxybenzoate decarboxylase
LKPVTVKDIVEFVVGRVMVALGIEETLPVDMQYGERSG